MRMQSKHPCPFPFPYNCVCDYCCTPTPTYFRHRRHIVLCILYSLKQLSGACQCRLIWISCDIWWRSFSHPHLHLYILAVICHCKQVNLYIWSSIFCNTFNGCNYSYQQSDLVKLDILLNGQPVDAMATIVHNMKAYRVGRELVEKLKKVIDRYFSLRNSFICFAPLLRFNSSQNSLNFEQANV